MQSTPTGAQAVERACALLGAFSVDQPSLTLGELAEQTGLAKSTARRLLSALCAADLLRQDEHTRLYAPGLRLLELAGITLTGLDLPGIATPAISELVKASGETAYLAALSQTGVIYLSIVESSNTVRLTAHVGMVLPVHTTATGKVLLAGLSPAELRARLSSKLIRPTRRTLSREQLLRQLATTRRRGYAISCEEHLDGVSSVAVPIRRGGRVVAALAVSGPSYRLPRRTLVRLAPRIQDTAHEIERRLMPMTMRRTA